MIQLARDPYLNMYPASTDFSGVSRAGHSLTVCDTVIMLYDTQYCQARCWDQQICQLACQTLGLFSICHIENNDHTEIA
ncbi:MAG: hypothetical protein CMQ46_13070 [Gammaproteobacteria bacterium]|nr:hypothetical protein [Gammaproteobacteria bacterium]MBJ56181.1 hypothetical protein [Gammaproteobacteria bacterium]HBN14468.1 hypothetical protein [Pseudohongiella sp.]